MRLLNLFYENNLELSDHYVFNPACPVNMSLLQYDFLLNNTMHIIIPMQCKFTYIYFMSINFDVLTSVISFLFGTHDHGPEGE